MNVIQASGAAVDLTEFDWGADRYLRDQTTVPPDGFAMLARDFDAILVGAFGDPRVKTNIHAKEILLGMRFKMDLYANVRPVRLLDAALCPLKGVEPKDVDFVVLRENTEGVYTDAGGVFKQGTADEIATQEDINTRKGVERIIRYAFEYCETAHEARRLAAQQSSDVRQVQRHDPCRRPVAARLQRSQRANIRRSPRSTCTSTRSACRWSATRASSTSSSPTTCSATSSPTLPPDCREAWAWPPAATFIPGKTSMFEPVTAPPRRSRERIMANPFGAILTAAMMLRHLGFAKEADKIEAAVLEAVRQKKTTQDIGGTLGTREAGEWVAESVIEFSCQPKLQSKYLASHRLPLLLSHSRQQRQLPPLPLAIHIRKSNLPQPPELRLQVQQLVRRILRLDREADARQEILRAVVRVGEDTCSRLQKTPPGIQQTVNLRIKRPLSFVHQ